MGILWEWESDVSPPDMLHPMIALTRAIDERVAHRLAAGERPLAAFRAPRYPTTMTIHINDCAQGIEIAAYEIEGRYFLSLSGLAEVLTGTQAQFSSYSYPGRVLLSLLEDFWIAESPVHLHPSDPRGTAPPTAISKEGHAIHFGGRQMFGSALVSLQELAPILRFSVDIEDGVVSVNTHEPYVSARGIQMTIDFLRKFPTLFGRVTHNAEWTPTGWAVTFYDSEGRAIDVNDAPFVRKHPAITQFAYCFTLFDTDNDGIPEILITFDVPYAGMSSIRFSELYQFDGNGFRLIEIFQGRPEIIPRDGKSDARPFIAIRQYILLRLAN